MCIVCLCALAGIAMPCRLWAVFLWRHTREAGGGLEDWADLPPSHTLPHTHTPAACLPPSFLAALLFHAFLHACVMYIWLGGRRGDRKERTKDRQTVVLRCLFPFSTLRRSLPLLRASSTCKSFNSQGSLMAGRGRMIIYLFDNFLGRGDPAL